MLALTKPLPATVSFRVPSMFQSPVDKMLPSLGVRSKPNDDEVLVCDPVRPVMVMIEPPGIRPVSHLRVIDKMLDAPDTGVLCPIPFKLKDGTITLRALPPSET